MVLILGFDSNADFLIQFNEFFFALLGNIWLVNDVVTQNDWFVLITPCYLGPDCNGFSLGFFGIPQQGGSFGVVACP